MASGKIYETYRLDFYGEGNPKNRQKESEQIKKWHAEVKKSLKEAKSRRLINEASSKK